MIKLYLDNRRKRSFDRVREYENKSRQEWQVRKKLRHNVSLKKYKYLIEIMSGYVSLNMYPYVLLPRPAIFYDRVSCNIV